MVPASRSPHDCIAATESGCLEGAQLRPEMLMMLCEMRSEAPVLTGSGFSSSFRMTGQARLMRCCSYSDLRLGGGLLSCLATAITAKAKNLLAEIVRESLRPLRHASARSCQECLAGPYGREGLLIASCTSIDQCRYADMRKCQRRSKTRPCGGAKVGHFGSVRSLSP